MKNTLKRLSKPKSAIMTIQWQNFGAIFKQPKRDPKNGDSWTVGKTDYTFDGERWCKVVKHKDEPEFNAATLFGDFTINGTNFIAFKYPTKVNWNKKIVPALRRLVRKITGKPASKVFHNVDGLGDQKNPAVKCFDSLKGCLRYEYDTTTNEFSLCAKG